MLSKRTSGVLRGLAILAVLGIWLGIGAVGGQAQGKLSSVQTNDAAASLPSSAESTKAAELSAAFVTSESLPGLVVITSASGGALTPQQLTAVTDFAGSVAAIGVPGAGPQDPQTIGDALTAPPVVVPSKDGEAALITFSLDAALTDTPLADGESLTPTVVTALREALAAELADSGLTMWLTGPAGFVADLVVAFGGIDTVLLLVALVAVLLILGVVYRSPILPFVVILTAVFALCLAGLVVYHLADAGTLVLNGQAQGILSILVVGASVDYSLFVVARYREELGRVAHPVQAMRVALRASFEPVLASAGTVTAGLLCLLLSDLASNRSLGPVAAIGIVSAFLGAMTLLPAMLLVGGRRSRGAFWPRVPHLVMAEEATSAAVVPTTGLWARIAHFVARHDRRVWVITALALAACAAFVPTLNASGTSESAIFLTQVDSVDGEKVLAEHFDGGNVQPATVIAPEVDLDAVLASATGVDGVVSAAAVTADSGTGQPGAPAQGPLTVIDGLVRIDVTTAAAADTQEGVETVAALREAVHAVSADALVGGAAAERLDTQQAGTRDLQVIVPVVLAVILVILMLLLRSVLSAVLLMAANVLSFGAALGVAAIVFNHVFGFPGADPTVPLYAFCFLVALGVDYTIFLMTRVREETITHGTREGVVRGLTVTGSVITSAGVVLAATFAALGIIPLIFLAQIAFIVAFGVLLDTIVVRTLLVPALVHDIGGAVWWPSSLDRGAPEPTAIATDTVVV
ncbi:putative drug exporter of the RND superfamily [Sanguibacter gelidistatuariae]|uniref:Putative drug exporter of the RND superfamily n=1 Tax=Sanguibacter gelidistatuariae TaxID=1814289 RepID=A0A1G6R7Y0_9MICO|nr:MMPL family transporter [Sanguibacter gelidistatuariae]SDD00628.1 putative drug exporter of the RND superfamily [Sanguibacter gelidistatuariae]